MKRETLIVAIREALREQGELAPRDKVEQLATAVETCLQTEPVLMGGRVMLRALGWILAFTARPVRRQHRLAAAARRAAEQVGGPARVALLALAEEIEW